MTAYPIHRTDPVRVGATVFATGDTRRTGIVAGNPFGAYPAVEDGLLFLVNTGTATHPFFTFGMLTGNTRRMFGRNGIDCPTIALFHVETTAITVPDVNGDDQAIVIGVPGDRIPGTWAVRPENVVSS